ncbi:NitT/TauT family transport system permease protein [Microbacterium foliorum]|uniref:ABC transporter permease n=1 Tax=Microbacterium foliorum TaxID=104336 RepID=UPI0020A072C8|nr:ABC transporter permease [Microbacterium foliorum]MCP1428201.1 NitT/TauT family transport system permease protein [Microbacterium foliorum]
MTAVQTQAGNRTAITTTLKTKPARPRPRVGLISLQVGIIVAFLAIWQIGASNGWISTFLFSSPAQIITILTQNASTGQLWTDIGVTGYEVLVGYAIGAVGGSVIGLLLWYSKFVADLSAPFITAIGSIPVLAVAPMMIIWFGTGELSKIVIVAFSCVIISLTNAYRGAQKVDGDILNLMRSFGGTKTQAFVKAIVPGAMPWVLAGLKLNVGFAIIGAVVGEFISSNAGVGHMIVTGSLSFSMSVVLAGVVVVMVMVLVFAFLIDTLERILFRWER